MCNFKEPQTKESARDWLSNEGLAKESRIPDAWGLEYAIETHYPGGIRAFLNAEHDLREEWDRRHEPGY